MFQETLVRAEVDYRMARASRMAELGRWRRLRRADRRAVAAGRPSDTISDAVSGLALSAAATTGRDHETLVPAVHGELSPIEDSSPRTASDYVGV